jgi:hypothetical protein
VTASAVGVPGRFAVGVDFDGDREMLGFEVASDEFCGTEFTSTGRAVGGGIRVISGDRVVQAGAGGHEALRLRVVPRPIP